MTYPRIRLEEFRTRLVSDVVTGKYDVREVELPSIEAAKDIEDIYVAEGEIDGADCLIEHADADN